MPRRKAGPRIYRRTGRPGLWASFSRDERHIPLGTDDDEEARLALADLIQRRAAKGPAPAEGELGELFLEVARRARTNHAPKYAYDLNLKLTALLVWLGERGISRPDQVSLGTVERFKDEKINAAEPLTARSVNRYLDVWKKAHKLAVDQGQARAGSLHIFRKLREPRAAPHQRGLTMAELDSFLCALDDERDFWFFRTVAGSGVRLDEARHLLPSSLQGAHLVISPQPPGTCRCHPRGWNTKSYRYRKIPVSSDTGAAAASYAVAAPTMNLDEKALWKRLQAARKRAGHDWEWSIHELRRAWASHMLAAGHKLADISRWIGHADVLTTMRYLRVVEDNTPHPDDLPL